MTGSRRLRENFLEISETDLEEANQDVLSPFDKPGVKGKAQTVFCTGKLHAMFCFSEISNPSCVRGILAQEALVASCKCGQDQGL